MALSKGAKKLFDFLKTKSAGDILSQEDVLAATAWKATTLKTYVSKNKFAHYILPTNENLTEYKVVQDGTKIDESEFSQLFTQKNPAALVLSKGDILTDDSGQTFELVDFLGNGAVGHVWKAKQAGSSTFVALKIANPRPDLVKPTAFENVKKRFEREAKNGTKLDSDNIIKINTYGKHKTFPFLVMPVASESVGDSIKKHGKLPQHIVLEISKSVALGLDYLHSKKLVHRDVKPDNILKTIDDDFVLADLGIVKWSDFSEEVVSAGTITNELVQLGSWFYMAPEQLKSPHDASELSDIYAFGVSMYHMLTGTHLTPSDFAAAEIEKTSDMCQEVHQLILSMTCYNEEKRPTIQEVLNTISQLSSPS